MKPAHAMHRLVLAGVVAVLSQAGCYEELSVGISPLDQREPGDAALSDGGRPLDAGAGVADASARRDASARDGGPSDAGELDASAGDGGPVDAASDASSDAGRDGGSVHPICLRYPERCDEQGQLLPAGPCDDSQCGPIVFLTRCSVEQRVCVRGAPGQACESQCADIVITREADDGGDASTPTDGASLLDAR